MYKTLLKKPVKTASPQNCCSGLTPKRIDAESAIVISEAPNITFESFMRVAPKTR